MFRARNIQFEMSDRMNAFSYGPSGRYSRWRVNANALTPSAGRVLRTDDSEDGWAHRGNLWGVHTEDGPLI